MSAQPTNRRGHFFIMKIMIVCLVLTSLFISCADVNEETATLKITLTDVAPLYDQVNVDIQGVQVHSESGDQPSGWVTLSVDRGVYNLMDLSNGLEILLATDELPAGKISQIRMLLGRNNIVVVQGVIFPLYTPNDMQSGLTINVSAQLVAGKTQIILLDFDAAKSVIKDYGEGYILKPVIYAINDETSGSIQGIVAPLPVSPAIFIMMGRDTIATGYTDGFGKFRVRGVPSGTYSVGFEPGVGYVPMFVEGVRVTNKNITNLGTVTIL